jgi:hypothetical protein
VGQKNTQKHRQRQRRQHQQRCANAQLRHLIQRDARTEQRHTKTQQRAARPFDARFDAWLLGQKMTTQADQQCIQQLRPTRMRG